MSKKVCEAIKSANDLFKVEKNDLGSFIKYDDSLKAYCPTPNHLNKQECTYYEQVVASAFIALLTLFKNDDDDEEDVLEDDKLAEYAILWLCYKINQETHKFSNLNKFYNKYIMNNEKNIKESNGAEAYKSYKDIINNKICSNTINIKETSKLYEAFEILCKMYNELDDDAKNCTKCLEDANKFVSKYEDLNKDSNITKNNHYYQVWNILSTGYDNFKKKCVNDQSSFPSLPPLPTIEQIQLPAKCSEELSIQPTVLSPDAASSSSSIASKLIPALLIFAIPVFLGISYKYSLFGFDKRAHRQYLREKIKKIKKKINLNI
ncbi:CIR protein [Plasmodium chabaudi chabaudi]|uniref:CIR protein n=1 Tax=Plasmodium chabaudi chabaudi TaxID=31271 RepID=A0A4V0K4K5_PLACU|nr:CIR protein [Plasmodium chabaudi chabaudi]VTZ67867.1 CIR protein [Plasmodium chabaudi chabaudi]|eukprot:XP_016654384.1 CIR protein [Plasmodium chabaudi chabaudi]